MLERETDHRFLGVISVDFIWIGWGKSWEIWKYGNGLDPPPKNLQSFQVIGQGVGGKDTLRLGLQIELRESEGFFFWVVNLQAMVCSCKSLAGAVMKVISHDKPCFFYSIFIVWSFRRSLFDRLGGRWCVCWCPKRRHGMARWHDGTGMTQMQMGMANHAPLEALERLRANDGFRLAVEAVKFGGKPWTEKTIYMHIYIYICKYRQHELYIYIHITRHFMIHPENRETCLKDHSKFGRNRQVGSASNWIWFLPLGSRWRLKHSSLESLSMLKLVACICCINGWRFLACMRVSCWLLPVFLGRTGTFFFRECWKIDATPP